MGKILVCITPQSNSQRLIDKGAYEAKLVDGRLYILNVYKGDNIFNSEQDAELLENLFSYGSQKGGTVHALCGDDIPALIKGFVIDKKITKIVVGEPPEGTGRESVLEGVKQSLEGFDIEIITLKRET